MCISNILLVEDTHLPSPLILIYEKALERAMEEPEDENNQALMRLCNYIFRNWHDIRTELCFIRDVCAVTAKLSRRFTDHAIHLNHAIEATPIRQKFVLKMVMRKLRQETRGRSLGEFLVQYEHTPKGGSDSLYDISCALFDKEDVLAYDNDPYGGATSGFFRSMLERPSALYMKQVVLHLIRTVCKLKLGVSESTSSKLFGESVPSWVEEDDETRITPPGHKARLEASRQNIMDMLIKQHQSSGKRKKEKEEEEEEKKKKEEKTVVVDDVMSIDTCSFRDAYRPHTIIPQPVILTEEKTQAVVEEEEEMEEEEAEMEEEEDEEMAEYTETQNALLQELSRKMASSSSNTASAKDVLLTIDEIEESEEKTQEEIDTFTLSVMNGLPSSAKPVTLDSIISNDKKVADLLGETDIVDSLPSDDDEETATTTTKRDNDNDNDDDYDDVF